MPDLAALPAHLTPIAAVIVAAVAIWKLLAEGVKAWRDARQIGRPQTPYEALAARVVALETDAADKAERIDSLEERVSQLRGSVRRLGGVLMREVAAVLAWIDRGAKPPKPDGEIAVIREVIHELTTPDTDKEH